MGRGLSSTPSVVGLLISRWDSKKLLPDLRAFHGDRGRRDATNRRMSDYDGGRKERNERAKGTVKATLDIPWKIISAGMPVIEFSRIIRRRRRESIGFENGCAVMWSLCLVHNATARTKMLVRIQRSYEGCRCTERFPVLE